MSWRASSICMGCLGMSSPGTWWSLGATKINMFQIPWHSTLLPPGKASASLLQIQHSSHKVLGALDLSPSSTLVHKT